MTPLGLSDGIFISAVKVSYFILFVGVICSLPYYFYLLQTSWSKIRHQSFIYSLLFINILLVFTIVSYVVGSISGWSVTVVFVFLYGQNLLALAEIILITIFDSFVLETFSVLLDWVTVTRMQKYRGILASVFLICMAPSIIQFYYAFTPDPEKDTPALVAKLTAIGGSGIAVVATLVDTVQTLVLVSTVFNWSLTRKRKSGVEENKDMYVRSVILSIGIMVLDWVGIAVYVYTLFISDESRDGSIVIVTLRMFVLQIIMVHSFVVIYQFELVTRIAVSHVPLLYLKKEPEEEKKKVGREGDEVAMVAANGHRDNGNGRGMPLLVNADANFNANSIANSNAKANLSTNENDTIIIKRLS